LLVGLILFISVSFPNELNYEVLNFGSHFDGILIDRDLERQKLRWFGRLTRMPQEKLAV